ncbi:hypothetical protein EJ05DRAFT_290447 [Pseudovirgaria hyperparasitica]|uniref:Major royal jelly protein n=1 Tax=Pseudovirgaria hyperparasitica TaxID=470096 RepID=A0A6A6WCP3_9PEZI|nr:uncharacterized protein EJ05DRAFT_290447 [Pseudovirgaria hyperparasitica]KAF2760598.1 hypothetical protein EJ05DRAFT_290447 [Pseudovirgaria hyperparasitica]
MNANCNLPAGSFSSKTVPLRFLVHALPDMKSPRILSMMALQVVAALAVSVSARDSSSGSVVTFQHPADTVLRTDNGTYGPEVEEFHYYYDQFPIGLAVSSKGRLFACYTRGSYSYTLGEAVNKTAEAPYPSAALNLPVAQLNTTFNTIPFGSANSTHLISVQAIYITPSTPNRPETLWALDTGRPSIVAADGSPTMPYAQPGGPKLVAISLANDSIYATYTFPASVHFPASYMNDLRFDLRPTTTASGQGVAYIADSSNEGRNGFIVVDLGSRACWRRLTNHPSVLRVYDNVPSYQGRAFYVRQAGGMPVGYLREGLDGIQISPCGRRLYYSPLTSPYLYSVPTANLLVPPEDDPLVELMAAGNVSTHGQRGGFANGFEGDSQGWVYQLMPEQNAIYYFDPADLQVHTFVRDPRIIWPDSAAVGEDGYFYMNINQLPYQPMWNDGVDGRVKPGAVLRAKIPNGGSKITGLG